MHVCVYICVCMYVCIYMYVGRYVCVYIYVYTYIFIYKEIYHKELVHTIIKAAMPQALRSTSWRSRRADCIALGRPAGSRPRKN